MNGIREHPGWLWALTILSVITFVGTLIAIPILVARIPPDYFTHAHRHRSLRRGGHPILKAGALVLKNTLGLILIAAGIAMLLLPGQGLLTVVMGVLVMDFPGKYRLERWLVRHPRVFRMINWMRRKTGKPPLLPPDPPPLDPPV